MRMPRAAHPLLARCTCPSSVLKRHPARRSLRSRLLPLQIVPVACASGNKSGRAVEARTRPGSARDRAASERSEGAVGRAHRRTLTGWSTICSSLYASALFGLADIHGSMPLPSAHMSQTRRRRAMLCVPFGGRARRGASGSQVSRSNVVSVVQPQARSHRTAPDRRGGSRARAGRGATSRERILPATACAFVRAPLRVVYSAPALAHSCCGTSPRIQAASGRIGRIKHRKIASTIVLRSSYGARAAAACVHARRL